jgi:hypothetical protein
MSGLCTARIVQASAMLVRSVPRAAWLWVAREVRCRLSALRAVALLGRQRVFFRVLGGAAGLLVIASGPARLLTNASLTIDRLQAATTRRMLPGWLSWLGRRRRTQIGSTGHNASMALVRSRAQSVVCEVHDAADDGCRRRALRYVLEVPPMLNNGACSHRLPTPAATYTRYLTFRDARAQ